MRKTSKREMVNLLFSAFLILGYLVSIYFLNTLLSAATEPFTKSVIDMVSVVVFGLLLFYATRVGEGKPIKRFNLPVLILVDIPALYVVIASLFPTIPFGMNIITNGIIVVIAGVVLGYAIPYTFLSGYEIMSEEEALKEEQLALEEKEMEESDESYEYTTLDIDVDNEETEEKEETNTEEKIDEILEEKQ